MSFEPYEVQAWIDHQQDPVTGEVLVQGTPVDKVHFDHLESGITVADARARESLEALPGKAPAVHTHDDRYFTESEVNSLVDGAKGSATAVQAEVNQMKAGTIKVGKAVIADSSNAVSWGNVNTKPATFPPSVHTHDDRYYTEGEVNGLVNERIHVGASCNKNWNWAGQGGQPTWMWGGNDPTNEYLYNPSNFNVNYSNSSGYAGSAGNADTVDGFHVAGKGTGRPGSLAENALYFVYE